MGCNSAFGSELTANAKLLDADIDLLDKFINGQNNETVPLGGLDQVPTPTLRNFYRLLKKQYEYYLEVMENQGDPALLHSFVYNVRRSRILDEEVKAGQELTLPVYYYPKRALLLLFVRGLICTPVLESNWDEGERQYSEVGADKNVQSNKVVVNFDIEPGTVIDCWVISSNLYEFMDKLIAGVAQAVAAAEAAEGSAEAAESSAQQAGEYLAEMEALLGTNYLESGVYNVRRVFAAPADIPAGGTLTLPVNYFPTRNVLSLNFEDTPCAPKIADVDNIGGGYQYTEVGTDPNVPSNQIVLGFAVKAGEKFDAWIVTSAFGKNLDAQQVLVDTAQGYANAAAESADESAGSAQRAEDFAGNAYGYANSAADSAAAAEGSATLAGTSAGEAVASAEEAATSASEAGTSAEEAADSATAATSSASSASDSANAAAGSATSASESAGAAEAVLDEIAALKEEVEAAMGVVTYLDGYNFGNPTDYADWQQILTDYALGREPGWDSVPNSCDVVNLFDGHEWIYNIATGKWIDFGPTAVIPATSESAGIVRPVGAGLSVNTAGDLSLGNHASGATTYGLAAVDKYGHAAASSATPLVAGTAAVGTDNGKFAREGHVHPAQTAVSGNAGTATKLATARTIALSGKATGTATSFDGSAAITIPVTAVTDAAKLTTARTIGGVSFDGSANINLPGVNAAGNQATSGNAATATKWAAARNIALTGAVTGNANLDGSGNISIATTAAAATGAPMPTTAAGVGQFVALTASSGKVSLPTGGTWAYFIMYVLKQSSGDSSSTDNVKKAGIAAGGTVLTSETSYSPSFSQIGGFAWRIA
jgi:hypothetical protein